MTDIREPTPSPSAQQEGSLLCYLFVCVEISFLSFFFFLFLSYIKLIHRISRLSISKLSQKSVQLLRTANYILRQSKVNLLKREKEESKIFRRSRFERGPKDRKASRSMINMNNSRPILSLITRTAASNNGVIVSIHPPLFHPPLLLLPPDPPKGRV